MAKLKKPRASRPRKSTSLTTFTLFLKLVPELRSMIWELASFQDPRNISIGKYPIFVRQAGHPPWCEEFGYKCTSTVPAVLRTCMQARTEGLKHYKLLEWVPKFLKGKLRLVNVHKLGC
ncbi:hypothetical protein BCIN_11g02760 [Botrytis cinerea B05.10]|uniref:2EXR domain-containing protein n=1 Tax=Botryotinia fuckeliana (strain B05.10) TaxID=332648 RepID=A0A384JX90_BOTFB|nr:hypothetical protein BCIN_11g02760 [Botrytis cinerea B05.10]ATZ54964.1 hypothetical protein BCIN_11g02760 [Botrytis cinerea B05.10]